MKSSLLKTLILVGLTGFAAVGVRAQSPAPKIAVIDLAKVFDGYWKTKATSDKINGERQAAQGDANAILQARAESVKAFQDLYTSATNTPAMTPDVKKVAEDKLNALKNDVSAKESQLQALNTNVTQTLQKEFADYKVSAIADITDVATAIAKKGGANLLIDKSNGTTYGTPTFLYVAADYSDITDAVLGELNKNHAMPAPAAMPADKK
jgi:outer membrane protein